MKHGSGAVRRFLGMPIALVAAAVLVGPPASGVVLEKGALQKHRQDIGKQLAKMVLCIAKAGTKCEAKGEHSGVECNLVDPDASTVSDKVAAKLAAAIGKCESKLALDKKGPASDYAAIGCPGDSNSGLAGDQPYADLDDYEANVGGDAREALSLLTPLIDVLCGGPNSENQAVQDCVKAQVAGLSSYAAGVFKCQEQCENDYSGGKGGGGPTDSTTQCAAGNAGADDNFADCVGGALDKAEAKGALIPAALAAVSAAINDATNDLYNEDDCP
jgi:hypothetical protein